MSREAALLMSQKRLWVLGQLKPELSAYQVVRAVVLRGELDRSVLEQSLRDVLQRHECLRAVFPDSAGEPSMVVLRHSRTEIECLDLSPLPPAERQSEVGELLSDLGSPLELARRPPIRLALLTMGVDEHLLVVAFHSVIADARSLEILAAEVGEMYRAKVRGERVELKPAPAFSPLAELQQKQLADGTFDQELEAWKVRLAGVAQRFPPASDSRLPKHGADVFEGEVCLSRATIEGLAASTADVDGENRTTAVVLAALSVVLSRLSGRDSLLVGLPLSIRGTAGGAVGPLSNHAPMAVKVETGTTFSSLLHAVIAGVAEAAQKPHVPFELLVRQVGLEETDDYPLLDLTLQQPWHFPLDLGDVEVKPYEPVPQNSPHALEVRVDDDATGITVRLVAQKSRYSRERISLILDQLTTLMTQAAANPDQEVRSLSLVTRSCRAVLPDPTQPLAAGSYPPVTEVVRSIVVSDPTRTAVRQGNRSLTYGELLAVAERAAHQLLAGGLVRHQTVAVCGQTSPGMIAAINAVLLAGGVVMTVSPSTPFERRRAMFEAASVVAVIGVGAENMRRGLPSEVSWLSLDAGSGEVLFGVTNSGGLAEVPLELPFVEPEDPAYIAFTSGTTGVPNAVLCHHRGLSHFVAWERTTFAVGRSDHCAQLSAPGFDVILRETYLALTSGAVLELPPEDADFLSHRILPWFEEREITVFHTVPSVVRAWLESMPSPLPKLAVRLVLVIGEPLTDTLVRRWREIFPDNLRFVNLYGATETNLAKCWFEVPEEVPLGVQPVGRPLPETQVLVINSSGVACGRAEPGEIVFRSPHISRGYLNAPELKDSRFTSNPFRDDPDDVVYRSGDRGRYAADGVLEILGRFDRQVQVRGVRVEPDDVQAVLARHPDVAAGVVTTAVDSQGSTILVAYVVPGENAEVDFEALRSHMKEWLPAAMIPARFVVLDGIPMRVGGKVDYSALPDPSPTGGAPASPYLTSRGELEEVLATLWCDLLGVEQVSSSDHFFLLGGHSLLATQLVSRIREELGVEVLLRALFDGPTLEAMAKTVLRAISGEKVETPPIERVSRTETIPLSFAQQRIYFMHQLDPTSSAYHLPSAFDLKGVVDIRAIEGSLQRLVERHEVLRTSFPASGGNPRQHIAAAIAVPLRLFDLCRIDSSERSAEARRIFDDLASAPFDLEHGPLLRVALISFDADHHVLVFNLHHIISDGWSTGVMLGELSRLYNDISLGRQQDLEPLAVQYADYAVWQRQWLNRDRIERELAYWKRQLANMELLSLPVDRPRSVAVGMRCGSCEQRLTKDLTGGLEELSRSSGSSMFMTTLAAFLVVLHRWTEQTDVVVGAPVANRHRTEVEGLIGFFVNNLVLRGDVSGDPTFIELLRRVRDMVLEAYAHQELPFDRLVEALAPQREIGQHPLVQVGIALHNVPKNDLELNGLEVSNSALRLETVRLDLEVHLWHRDGELLVQIRYNADLFDPETAERLLGQYERLLEGLVAAPESPVRSLPLLDPKDRARILSWSGTTALFPDRSCFYQLFEARVAENPDKVALELGDENLTYDQLNRLANRLARRLSEAGVGPEVLVGLCMERSLDLIVGILAVHKAGGAYLPLDPEYPIGRIRMMVEDSGAEIILTQERLLKQVALGNGNVVLVDDPNAPPREDGNLPPCSGPRSLAYVIYTSGSTGKPKGVEIEHRGVCNLVQAQMDEFGVCADDRVLQFASSSFDGSVWELLALAVGATLVLAEKPDILPGPPLIKTLRERQVTVATLPPSILIDTPATALPDLRILVVAGDACTQELIETWAEGRRFINGYGPTESTVCATLHVCSPELPLPLIGRPIANQEVYILDSKLGVVPIGVPGELYIGGAGVARGYLNRPELTAERFVDHPFKDGNKARLYRTGDLGRYHADGTIEFLGRVDQQTKIRGHRIELGEIEAVLRQHDLVRQVAVVDRDDLPGGRGLVAYVVPEARAFNDHPLRRDWEDEHIQSWQAHRHQLYSRVDQTGDGLLEMRSAKADGTSAAASTGDVREWIECTVDRLRCLSPSSVLEVGCGAGLTLRRLAPEVERYVATDFSEAALTRLASTLVEGGSGLPQVELRCLRADALKSLYPRKFELVFLNSVVHYFPDVLYLMRVLEGAIEVTEEGGFIVVGDVRSLPLLRLLSAAAELAQCGPEATLAELRDRAERRRLRQEELVLDPRLFERLVGLLPRIVQVAVLPKRGRGDNELTRYRYDVVLRLDRALVSGPAPQRLNWFGDGMTITGLRAMLGAARTRPILVEGLPNSYLTRELRLGELLAGDTTMSIAELRSAVARTPEAVVELDMLFEVGRQLGWRVTPSWAAGDPRGGMDLLFRPESDGEGAGLLFIPRGERNDSAPLELLSNNPLRSRLSDAMEPQLREHLREYLPEFMVPAAIVLLDQVPLSGSGKVDTRALPSAERTTTGSLYVRPRNRIEERLCRVWATVLGLDRVGIFDNFFDLGGDSILTIQVVSRAQRAGVPIGARDIFQNPTVAGLAQVAAPSEVEEVETEPIRQTSTLAPIQSWFLDLELAQPDHFNQNILLRVTRKVPAAVMADAIQDLVAHHDALRLRLVKEEGGWSQKILDLAAAPVREEDLGNLPQAEQDTAMQRVIADEQAGLSTTDGPTLRAVFFRLGDRRYDRLFMAAHHLAVDGVSWGVLLEDLQLAMLERLQGLEPDLGVGTTPYLTWVQRMADWAGTDEARSQADWWLEEEDLVHEPLPVDFDHGPNTYSSTQVIVCELDERDTADLLHRRGSTGGGRIEAFLVTALARSLCGWSGARFLWVDLEGHGRSEVVRADLSRTVGWFTAQYPAAVPYHRRDRREDSLRRVEAMLDRIPSRGVSYGALRYLSKDDDLRQRISALPSPPVNFNYMGRFDRALSSHRLFVIEDADLSPTIGPDNHRPHLLAINGSVMGGRLRFRWGYSTNRHRPETIRYLAGTFIDELRAMAQLGRTERRPTKTSSSSSFERATSPGPSLLVPMRATGAYTPLYLVHPVGGFVFCYAALASHLGPEQPVFAIQAWEDDREVPAFADIPGLAATYIKVIRRNQPSGPYLLAGWSMGGAIAFEMARQLTAAGEQVPFLALIDANVPTDQVPPTLARQLQRWNSGTSASGDDDRDLLDVLGLESEVEDSGFRPSAAMPEDAMLHRLSHHVRAMVEYKPEPWDGHMVLVRAEDQPEGWPRDLGWRSLVKGALDIVSAPGDHQSIMHGPGLEVMARALRRRLKAIATGRDTA